MTKQCPVCGTEFETENNRRTYCSSSCCKKASYRRNREKKIAYVKRYRQEHREYIKEYERTYYQNHKDHYREYQKHYQRLRVSSIKYPCWRYKAKNAYNIPDKLCLNCKAPECRFYHD